MLKKNNYFLSEYIYRLRLIKLMLVVLACAANLNTFSQDLNQRMTINLKNTSIGNFIKYVEDNSTIRFSYSPQSIPLDKKISIKAKNKPVYQILDKVFADNGIQYTLVENKIILKKSVNENTEITEKENNLSTYTISGYLRDKASGEILIGASVYSKINYSGTVTNLYGYYSLTLPKGTYDIVYSFIGYSNITEQIILNSDKNISVNLEAAKLEFKPVEISAAGKDSGIINPRIDKLNLTPSVLKKISGFTGNIDIVKSLQAVPGFQSYGDGSSLMYVRGGNSDQNQILVDEAPVFNPSHLFGFFSVLSPEAIKNVDVYKGDCPANYGGRLSSVVDIRTIDGNMNKTYLSGSLGLYTSDLTLQGPIIKEKFAYFLSARKSNINWLFGNNRYLRKYDVDFYDFNVKLNYQINTNNRIFLTLYKGNDDFFRTNLLTTNTFGINWNNALGVLRWNHVFNPKLFSNTTIYSSTYNYFLYVSKERNDYWNSSINNSVLKTDFSYFHNSDVTIKTGFELGSVNTVPGRVNLYEKNIQQKVQYIPEYHSKNMTVYFSYENHFNNRLTARAGIRIPILRNIGITKVYLFDSNHIMYDSINPGNGEKYYSYKTIEPRISLKYLINKFSFVNASYNRLTQCLQQISNSISPFTSLEVWIPSGPNVKPQQLDQFALGYYLTRPHSPVLYSVETFLRNYYNQIEYKDHADLLLNPLMEGELRFGNAKSYGVEVKAQKEKGKFTWWIAYAYSRSLKKIIGVNNSKEFPAFYDRPNDARINLCLKATKKLSFSVNAIYMTGVAFTTPIGFFTYNGYEVPIYGEKNNSRLPDYHRLDFSLTYQFNKPEHKFQHSFGINIYNVYGRKNPISVNFNKILDDKGNIVIPVDLQGNTEQIPTFIAVAGMIPVITYNFKF